MKHLIIILVLVLSCSSGNMNRKPIHNTEDKIVYKLTAKEDFRSGEPVNIQFRLENRSDEAFFFLKWNTPFEGFISDMFSVKYDGKEILYDGRMVKRGNPSFEDYLLINPGKSLDTMVDLSTVYNMKEKGVYLVGYTGRIHDFLFLKEKQKAENYFPRSPDVSAVMDIKGNQLSLNLGLR